VSLRAAFLAIVVGVVGAVGLFIWSEDRAGRLDRLLATLPVVTPTSAVGVRATATPTVAPPTATREPATPTREPTRAATVAAPRPTATPPPPTIAQATRPPPPTATRAPAEVELTRGELQQQFEQAVAGGAPLRDPRVTLLPPDRVQMNASVPVAIFRVPVEMEARLSIDERGAVRVTTTRVEAVGASLPSGVTAELGRRLDQDATSAIANALPAGASAKRVVVEPERIRVELAP
jgi:hypothetical protein